MHTQPYTPEPAFDIMLRGKGGERKKFNLTYWSADFHRENADYWCVCARVCGSIIHSSDWHYMMKKKNERERGAERGEHPFSADNSSVQRSPSNRTLHLFTAEMRLDSI